ncbi:virulence protein [Chryseobacterium potabilaquae]|jgi:virulence-associated protein VapD|uniref:Endoribonuclease VapD n=1 Tax=Chryseobacterium potabilaquae TaxID=2675057 RepID=A0A6N4X9H8_9FLAO|nr:virulence protein [Chryseobacterium potabilaquae]CAA7197445.1 Endoribonuclease VapD [Chryseobacterium potabilaquae]
MFAISFDMEVSSLKKHFGEPYNNAYFEIRKVLREYNFYNTQGSVYLSDVNDMANLVRAMIALKSLQWFKDSVRDIRAFRIEDWSNFTDFMKE